MRVFDPNPVRLGNRTRQMPNAHLALIHRAWMHAKLKPMVSLMLCPTYNYSKLESIRLLAVSIKEWKDLLDP